MTAPNREQIESFIRLLLGAGGPLAAWLVSRGMELGTLNMILTVALAVVPPLVSLVWSMVTHTDRNAIAVASAVPGVTKIKINPAEGAAVSPGAVAAAADPALPNVKMQA